MHWIFFIHPSTVGCTCWSLLLAAANSRKMTAKVQIFLQNTAPAPLCIYLGMAELGYISSCFTVLRKPLYKFPEWSCHFTVLLLMDKVSVPLCPWQCFVRLQRKCLCLYLKISASLDLGMRNFRAVGSALRCWDSY